MRIFQNFWIFVRKWRKVIICCVILYAVITCLTYWYKTSTKGNLKRLEGTSWSGLARRLQIIQDKFVLTDDFYAVGETNGAPPGPTIPKIIHQVWTDDDDVPCRFYDYQRSFITLNPGYVYYLWTHEEARQLIKERHGDLLETFDNTREVTRRDNIVKYVVLYEYGGIYADFDVKCLGDLDYVTTKYTCVLVPEPYEVSALLYNNEFTLTNTLMFCQARHPLLKQMVTHLREFDIFSWESNADGSAYFTYHLKQYITNESSNHSVQIATPRLFRREMSSITRESLHQFCRSLVNPSLRRRKGCNAFLKKEDSLLDVNKLWFVDHSLNYGIFGSCLKKFIYTIF